MQYIDSSIDRYLKDLAAGIPAPGGGSAAALQAALACALMSMVANFTISNKKYADVRKKAQDGLKRSEGLRKRFSMLIDKDIDAYSGLSNALKKYKKDTPELEVFFKKACDVPFGICSIAGEALAACRNQVEYGNKNLITDTAIAALMLESAFFAAKFNVYINLRYVKDERYVEKIHKVLSELEERIPAIKEDILHNSENIIVK